MAGNIFQASSGPAEATWRGFTSKYEEMGLESMREDPEGDEVDGDDDVKDNPVTEDIDRADSRRCKAPFPLG